MSPITLNKDYKQQVVQELLNVRNHYSGTDYQFAKKWGLSSSTFSLLKNAIPFVEGSAADRSVSQVNWLRLGRELNVSLTKKKWQIARTEVFKRIEEEVVFCKNHSKSMVLVDDCEIGKTVTGKALAKTLDNCFYIDCSQAKTKREFLKAFARALGVEDNGTYQEMKKNVKYFLSDVLTKPVIIVDEAGDLEYDSFLELKEFWNATDGHCGWYMMGADGLRAKIERGISRNIVGYREIFSRFSRNFSKVTPNDKAERNDFYKKLITDVLTVNSEDTKAIPIIIKKCLAADNSGQVGGLRRAESLLILSNEG